MEFKSYAEWGEDRIIHDFFGDFVGRFLNAGALDGKDRDNCYGLSLKAWHGTEVEPNPFMFAELIKNFADRSSKITCVNAALMPEPGLYKFYDTFHIKENWHQHTSTCVELPTPVVMDLVQREYYVAGITPQMLADHFGSTYAFVSLDIEGNDIPVLEKMAPLLTDTRLLLVEDTIPGAPFDEGYYKQLMDACAMHGFTKVVGRTHGPEKPANTLLTRP